MKKKNILLLSLILISLSMSFCMASAEDEGTKIRNLVGSSLVRIFPFEDGDGFGTGFFISDRYIVTNHHVVTPFPFETIGDDMWFIAATNMDVKVVYSAVNNDTVKGLVVQDWPDVDLAVVEVDPAYSNRTPIKLLPENKVVEGMTEYAIGFPGVNTYDMMTNDNPTITNGILSKISNASIGINTTPYKRLSYSSFINPGNSGGPIVDTEGNVIGIVNSHSTVGVAYYGIHVKELISRLNAAGIPFEYAVDNPTSTETIEAETITTDVIPTIDNPGDNSNDNQKLILYIIIGVLAVGVVGVLVMLLKKPSSPKTPSSPQEPEPVKPSSTSKASIKGIAGQYLGMEKPLSKTKDCVIGKDPSKCTVVFDGNAKRVSRVHCRIHYSNTHQCYIIQDLNSTNGTILVRGSAQKKVPTDSGISLKDGDLIYIPTKENTFQVNL